MHGADCNCHAAIFECSEGSVTDAYYPFYIITWLAFGIVAMLSSPTSQSDPLFV
ncbi:hypothetical protein NEOLEDRAFT_840750 [Neolentinus lepideus HHB14362 ss-1]|uniref:Uncharacterized protein n=1 Tax=Neolentinus lepideus HHB14362 ss-1 TaxID=1314782 RepID=A0A165P4C8_9AGAM|nr:hypothetical protein NEOLEDRAFT_840750 [Neolentinus lepideus HHB14362 ss-1]